MESLFNFKGMKLSRATNVDVEELVIMINEAYSYQDKEKGEQRTSNAKLTSRLQEVEMHTIRDHDRLVGCVYIEPRKDVLHFGLLTVTQRYRGTGLAYAVIKTIEDYARNKHFEKIGLDYMSLAPWLKSYYERYGFKETGDAEQWGTIKLVRMEKQL